METINNYIDLNLNSLANLSQNDILAELWMRVFSFLITPYIHRDY